MTGVQTCALPIFPFDNSFRRRMAHQHQHRGTETGVLDKGVGDSGSDSDSRVSMNVGFGVVEWAKGLVGLGQQIQVRS